MKKSSSANPLARYLDRHALHPPLLAEPPHPELGLVVVIPCHDEPGLLHTLEDLRNCDPPGCVPPDFAAEVIVVINSPAGTVQDVAQRHRAAVLETGNWIAERIGADCGGKASRVDFHLLDFPRLPPRHAGVGLARKLGMDEAVARFLAVDGGETGAGGIIACLDADCRVEPGYLRAVAEHFRRHPHSPACSIHFEHDWRGEGDARLARGIVQYELHLRCVVAGLRLAGHPHAFHTVGSSMAVRAGAYARQGGMNRRKAAEDFYFLAKLMPLGGFTVLGSTTVRPSCRTSHRVPFGTGRTMTEWIGGDRSTLDTYAPNSYRDLGTFLSHVDALPGLRTEGLTPFLDALPPAMAGFLEASDFAAVLEELRDNSASGEAFRKRFFRWLDRFRVLKYLHHARDTHHPLVPVEMAARELWQWRMQGSRGDRGPAPPPFSKGENPAGSIEPPARWLEAYRRWDRGDRGDRDG